MSFFLKKKNIWKKKKSAFLGFYPECSHYCISRFLGSNEKSILYVPSSHLLPFLFLTRTLNFQAINSSCGAESKPKSPTSASAGVVRVQSVLLLPQLPSPSVSCFREQFAGWAGVLPAWPLLHNQVKIPSPVPASAVPGTDRSVTGDQTGPWIRSGVAFPVLLRLPFVLDVL